jgi:fucose permease
MLILAAILAIFVYGIIAAMLGTILPDISKRFNLSPKQNGNIAMAQAIGLMVGGFFVGPLMDSEGKKVGLLLGLGLVTLALVGLRAASGYGSVAALMFLLGTGGGAVVTGANTLPPFIKLGDMSTGGVFNILNLFFGLGGLVTPLIAARLFQNQSGKLLFFAGGLGAVAFLVNAIAPLPGASATVAFQASMVGDLLTKPALLLLCAMLFLYVACEVGVWNWLVRHLIAQGVSEGKALTVLSLGFALGLLIGRVVVSQVLGSVSPEAVLIGSGIFMAVMTFVMLQSKSDAVAWVTVFLAGIAMAPVFPTTLSLANSFFPNTAATAVGIATTFGWLGLVVSSPIIGAIAGNDPRGLRKALLILPTFSVLMAFVAFLLSRLSHA